ASGAGQDSVRIERQRASQKIVGRISVEQRADPGAFAFAIRISDDHQPFFTVRDVKKSVEKGNRLLLVFRKLYAQGVDAEGSGRSDGYRVFGRNEKLLTERRDRSRRYTFGKALVIDVGDVEDAKAAFSLRRIGILTARLHVENRARVLVAG